MNPRRCRNAVVFFVSAISFFTAKLLDVDWITSATAAAAIGLFTWLLMIVATIYAYAAIQKMYD